MGKHLPPDHLFLASSKRVLALILEEIAIDNSHNQDESLLVKSEELHLFALNLARLNFGECNVQTAKHYGNLGRLYQVKKFIYTLLPLPHVTLLSLLLIYRHRTKNNTVCFQGFQSINTLIRNKQTIQF